MIWPLKKGKDNHVPDDGTEGGFLEDRLDRVHCGVDLYASKGDLIHGIENGKVVDVSVFTSSDMIPYWNTTFQVLILSDSGLFYRYAELEDTFIEKDQIIKEGDVIGSVGQVLNPDAVHMDSPEYIKRLVTKGNLSMLHLEIYTMSPPESSWYSGGNWFGKDLPNGLKNPRDILNKIDVTMI